MDRRRNRSRLPFSPAPTLTLTATPSIIIAGQTTTLAWVSTNTTSCTASGGWSGTLPLLGELVVATASTTTYTLTCTGAGGSTAKSVTVTVNGGPARLTLTWVDNAGGTAIVKVERKTGSTGTYAQIAATSIGATEYVDTTPVTGVTYCHRVRASKRAGTRAIPTRRARCRDAGHNNGQQTSWSATAVA